MNQQYTQNINSVQYLENIRHQSQNQELKSLYFGQEPKFYTINKNLDTYRSLYFQNQKRTIHITQQTTDQYTNSSFPYDKCYPDNFQNLTDQTLFYLLQFAPHDIKRVATVNELEQRGWRYSNDGWTNAAKRQKWKFGELGEMQ